jgi:hypothetical protein
MEIPDMNWRKATYTHNGGNCVEVADSSGTVMVRDTKNRDGGALAFGTAAWERFIKSL